MTQEDFHGTGTWQRLISTALVGVNRRAVPDTPDLPATAAREPAAVLLDRAAAATVQQRAGYVPETVEPMSPAPEDPRPMVSDAAARRLEFILTRKSDRLVRGNSDRAHNSLLLEWLGLAEARNLRLPPESLPRLFDVGRRDRSLRPSIITAAGARGWWLAGLNAAWSYAGVPSAPEGPFDPGEWRDGTAAERQRALATLRAEDPGRARDLLAEVWSNERAESRRALLRTLETRLSIDDELFLDRALDDRGPSVRATALALLAQLPDSAHAERLCEHARRFVQHGERAGQNHGLRVSVPQPDDADLARDLALAMTTKQDRKGDLGREWLLALLTRTPLRFWPRYLDTSNAGVVAAAVESDQTLFLAGIAHACVVQENQEWARLLVSPLEAHLNDAKSLRSVAPELATLLALLPNDERCSWVAERTADPYAYAFRKGVAALAGNRWTQELGERVADHIEEQATGKQAMQRIHACDDAALCMPPTMHERFTPVTSETHRDMVALEATLRFRREMHEEFG